MDADVGDERELHDDGSASCCRGGPPLNLRRRRITVWFASRASGSPGGSMRRGLLHIWTGHAWDRFARLNYVHCHIFLT